MNNPEQSSIPVKD